MLQIQSPFKQFFDTDGYPLDNGNIYIGAVGSNPETNPIVVYYDDAGTLPVVQPIKTINGYMARAGSPAIVYVNDENYSITIKNKNGELVANELNALSFTNLQNNLASSTGSSLIGHIANGVGAVLTTIKAYLGFMPSHIYGYMTTTQIFDSMNGTGNLDLSAPIQAAIDANYGKELVFAGRNRIDTQLNVLKTIVLNFKDNLSTLMLGTQNMNGIVIGDGTSTTREQTYRTKILRPTFIPMAGVAPFTSGACIFENYVAYILVENPTFFGLDGGVKKLYQGLRQFQVLESETPYISSNHLNAETVYAIGGGTLALGTVGCNYDFARIYNSGGNGVYFGGNCGGNAFFRPIMFNIAEWGFVIEISGQGALNNWLHFPDIEISQASTGGGILFKTGSALFLDGGWIGLNGTNTIKKAIQVDSGANSMLINNLATYSAQIILNGVANTVHGGDFVGDAITNGSAVIIGGNDNSIVAGTKIRQWNGFAIDWTSGVSGMRIGDVIFKNNLRDIKNMTSSGFPLQIGSPKVSTEGTTDRAYSYAAATFLDIPANRSSCQVTGGTSIQGIGDRGEGSMLTIQAGAGGLTFSSGGNIQYKTTPPILAAFKTITFIFLAGFYFEV